MGSLSLRAIKAVVAAVTFAAMAGITLAAGAVPAAADGPFIGVPGAQIYSNGEPVTITMEGGSARNYNQLYLELYVGSASSLYLGSNREVGTSTAVGTSAKVPKPKNGTLLANNREGNVKRSLQAQINPNDELVFYILGWETTDGYYTVHSLDNPDFIFYSGPGYRNAASDGEAHAAVSDLGNGAAQVGFEDLPEWYGSPQESPLDSYRWSDWDFNDLIFTVQNVTVLANYGFVTGGGWIDSPRGAYNVNTPAYIGDAGKANFGFVAKYIRPSDRPEGNLEFNLHFADNARFQSTSLYWLDVEGPRARLRGAGTLNGTSLDFLLTTVDGKVSGGGGTDRFRLKTWVENLPFRNPYYNWVDSHDLIQSIQSITDGSIVIHR